MNSSSQSNQVLEARASHNYPFSPTKVFDAWLDSKVVAQWMFGPAIRDEEVVSIEIDPKPGGAFSFLVRRGNTVIDHIGTYLKIERPRLLEFNWGVKGMSDSSRVIVEIKENAGGCSLTLIHELNPAWSEYLDRCKQGWTEMLLVLEKYLKKNSK